MALSTTLQLKFIASLTNALDLVTAEAPLSNDDSETWATGTGASQADQIFSDQRTISAGGTDTLDLAGTLTNALGTTISLARVKLLYIFSAAANVNNIRISGVAAQWLGPLNDSLAVFSIRPGGKLLITAPDATAYAVTATTADILRLTLSDTAGAATYDVIVVGATA